MTVLLGCIADDFTGGTDLAGMLVMAWNVSMTAISGRSVNAPIPAVAAHA